MDESVRYLWSAATQLPNSSPSLQLLKAHYAEKSFAIAKRTSCEFPDNLRGTSTMCPKCTTFWANGAFRMRFKTAHKSKRRTKNFVIKHYKDKKNSKLRRLARKLALKSFKSAEITCKICRERTKIPMIKFAQKETPKVIELPKKVPPIPSSSSSKKKKKKRDPFAGLSKTAILSVQQKKVEKPIQKLNIGKLATILKKKASITPSNKLDTMLK